MFKKKSYFADFLYLQHGKTVADAREYFKRIEPVVKKHGLVRIKPGFVIQKAMAGDPDMDLINIWTIADPEATFPSIAQDPAYQAHLERRNATFDMSKTQMFIMTAAPF